MPREQTVIADYYAIELLEKNDVTATLRKKEMGHQPVRHLPDMSMAIFQQDGASSHQASNIQD